MPHLTLEYSSNLAPQTDISVLFEEIHGFLSDTAGIRIENCKSRARIADPFFVGTGEANNAFVHLDVRFMEGRTLEVKQQLGEQIKDALVTGFGAKRSAMDIQITVEVRDIERANYVKYPQGTLTPL